MKLREALEICITRHEVGRDCINCRFKGEDCITMHREAANKLKELRQIRERKESEVE